MRVTIVLVLLLSTAPATRAQQPDATTAARTVRGVVVTANDVPLARVRIAVTGAPASQPPVFTDARGEFDVRVPDAASARVTFAKAGYIAFTSDISRAQSNEVMRVRLSRSAAISGHVQDRTGARVMLASVTARRIDGPAPADAPPIASTTNDLGEYRLGGLAAGAYVVTARPPATGRPNTAAAVDEQTVNISLGAEVANIGLLVGVVPESISVSPPDSSPDATASMRGRVVGMDGLPIAGAMVSALRNGAVPRRAETDARGLYVIDRLTPGEYTVEARKQGFLDRQYGQDRTSTLGRRVSLQKDQTAGSIDVTLARGGAIAGTIVDEFGEPVQGVSVTALQLVSLLGRTRALRVPGSGGRTDDRGQYRLFNLQPGAYVVSAQVGEALASAAGYPPMFYPGAVSIDQALLTKVDLGSTAGAIDLTLTPARAHRVTGTVVDSTGKPAAVGLVLVVSERSGAIQIEPTSGRSSADGSFAFTNVPPGDYVVQAMASIPGTGPGGITTTIGRQFATTFVTVANADPPALRLRLSLGATLSGRITHEGIVSPPSPVATLLAYPTDFDRAPLIGAGSTGFSVQPDGAFEYKGVFGPALLLAQPRNPDWYVKSITLKGRELSDTSFDFGSEGTFSDISVVISGAGAAVTGRVTDERAAPVRDYSVVVFTTAREKWLNRSQGIKTARPTQDGGFKISGLPPRRLLGRGRRSAGGNPGRGHGSA